MRKGAKYSKSNERPTVTGNLIIDLCNAGKIAQAIIVAKTMPAIREDALLLSARWHVLQNEIIAGTISKDDEMHERNRILKALIDIAEI